MVNSVDVNLIRKLCDKVGLSTRVSEDGKCVLCILEADENFRHDVVMVLSPQNGGKRFDISGYGGVKVPKEKLAEALMRINKHHNDSICPKTCIDKDMDIVAQYSIWVEHDVSEEFLIEDFITSVISATWGFFRDNFSDYVK